MNNKKEPKVENIDIPKAKKKRIIDYDMQEHNYEENSGLYRYN